VAEPDYLPGKVVEVGVATPLTVAFHPAALTSQRAIPMPEDSLVQAPVDSWLHGLRVGLDRLITMIDSLENESDPQMSNTTFIDIALESRDLKNRIEAIADAGVELPPSAYDRRAEIGQSETAATVAGIELTPSGMVGFLMLGNLFNDVNCFVDKDNNYVGLAKLITPQLMMFAQALPTMRKDLMVIRRCLNNADPNQTPADPAPTALTPDSGQTTPDLLRDARLTFSAICALQADPPDPYAAADLFTIRTRLEKPLPHDEIEDMGTRESAIFNARWRLLEAIRDRDRGKARAVITSLEGLAPLPFFRLGELGEAPVANGEVKAPLTPGRHKVLEVLVEVGPKGLGLEDLREISGHPTAERMLKALSKDPDWAAVIKLAKGSWKRYRLDRRCFT
jgi:hypothetical protein